MKIGAEMYPELSASEVAEKITPRIRQKVYDSLTAEQKLFYLPTAGESQVS